MPGSRLRRDDPFVNDAESECLTHHERDWPRAYTVVDVAEIVLTERLPRA